MGSYSPYKRASRLPLLSKPESGSSQQLPDMTHFMWTLSNMICACHNDSTEKFSGIVLPTTFSICPLIQRHAEDVKYIYDKKLFTSLLKQAYNIESNKLILTHLCWEDKNRSSWIVYLLKENFLSIDVHNYISYAKCIFNISDGLAMWRCNLLLNYTGRTLLEQLGSDYSGRDKLGTGLTFLIESIKTKPIVAGWFKKSSNGALKNSIVYSVDTAVKNLGQFKSESRQKLISELLSLKKEFISFFEGTLEVEIHEFPADYDKDQKDFLMENGFKVNL
jgi:hypothetical protein